MGDNELRQEIDQLRAEINRVDEWSSGVFQVLVDVLPPLLKLHPDLASEIAPSWQRASVQFDLAVANAGQLDDEDETLERLEARKMLFRMFDLLRLWPQPGGAK